jgi:uncharacterized protein YabN with tetrapyrrole methylase and pyrophosphatase domain
MVLPTLADEAARVAQGVAALAETAAGPQASEVEGMPSDVADGEGASAALAEDVGSLLFDLVGVSRALGVDPETALLARARNFRADIDDHG